MKKIIKQAVIITVIMASALFAGETGLFHPHRIGNYCVIFVKAKEVGVIFNGNEYICKKNKDPEFFAHVKEILLMSLSMKANGYPTYLINVKYNSISEITQVDITFESW